MHRHFHYFHRFITVSAVGIITSALALAACSSNDDVDLTATVSATTTTSPTVPSPGLPSAARLAWPAGQPVKQSQWVRDRLAAVKQIYGFTPEGEEWIDGYDLRQMVEQPAWFGSHGYELWAGAGEAVPRSVLHELGHSYWGAFTVAGHIDLSWEHSNGIAPAMQAYRDDLATFLAQPPDRFEPLRDRFRNLPGLNSGGYPDLFHFGEADLLYMTGGNLALVPPILRKYVSGYLLPQGVGPETGEGITSWDSAMSWFYSLSGEDRRIAGEVFGLQHFPHGTYSGLPGSGLSGLDPSVRTAYEQEERQRLIDFSEQFEGILEREFSLVDAAGADRGFDFWRGYLSDKLALHGRHPDVLSSIGTERANDLAAAMDFYSEIAGASVSEQVEAYRRSQDQPLLPELAVLLKPRTVVELFAGSSGDSGISVVLGSRAARLTALVDAVDRIEQADTAQAGAAELENFLRATPEDELRADIFLLIDLLRSTGDGLSGRVMPALSHEALLLLLRIQPAAARSFEIGPGRLLPAVGITNESSLAEISAGAKMLATNSSGNFGIDAAYDSAVFSQLERFVESDPAGVLNAVAESGMRIVPWISHPNGGAFEVMRREPDRASLLLMNLSGSRETPERIIHLVAKSDPELAAMLTGSIVRSFPSNENFTASVISQFVYDAYWSERNAGPNLEPERFAEYVAAVVELSDERQVSNATTEVLEMLEAGGATGDLEAGGVGEFKKTARAALDASTGAIEAAFRNVAVSSGLLD